MKKRLPKCEISITLEQTVNSMITHYCEKNSSLIVGVSGGVDSMVLMTLLHKIRMQHPMQIVVAHVNHMLRGTAADKDEELVRQMAMIYGLEYEVERVDVEAYSKEQKLTIEEAGRNIRRSFFFRLKEQYGAEWILTAHHRDDNVETMLMNLIRGSSVRGLSGISMISKGMIRPLLDFAKDELLHYAARMEVPFNEDATNKDTAIRRNLIRHELIPMIEKINPNFKNNFHEKSFYFGEIDEMLHFLAMDFIRQFCEVTPTDITCQITPLKGLFPTLQKSIIQSIYEIFHGSTEELSADQIYDFLDLISKERTGSEKMLGNRLSLSIAYGKAYFQKEKSFDQPHLTQEVIALPLPGSLSYPGGKIITRFHHKIPKKAKKNAVYVSLKNPENQLYIRSVKEGDRFHPAGMDGSKKVQDFFVDRKIRREDRKNVPIIVDEQDQIVAVGRYRIDKGSDPSLYESPVVEIQILEIEE
mgnify:CR=1 FL=1